MARLRTSSHRVRPGRYPRRTSFTTTQAILRAFAASGPLARRDLDEPFSVTGIDFRVGGGVTTT